MAARYNSTKAVHNSSTSPPRVVSPADPASTKTTPSAPSSRKRPRHENDASELPATTTTPPPPLPHHTSPPPPRAVVVEWSAQSSQCERKVLPTPGALRAFLADAGGDDSDDDGQWGTATTTATARGSGGENAQRRRPLVTLRGLDADFVDALLAAGLDLDPGFFAAHAARRRYNQPRRRRSSGCAQWAYPELVSGLGEAVWAGRVPIDGAGCALVRAVSDREDLAGVECRASIWVGVGRGVDILVLDGMVWDGPDGVMGGFKKGVRRGGRMKLGLRGPGDGTGRRTTSYDVEDEELPSLEDLLQEALSEGEGAADLMDILEEVVYDKWLDFFDVLTPRQLPLILDGTSLEYRALQVLETNAAMSMTLSRRRRDHNTTKTDDASPDWPSLLQRLRDRAALLPTVQLPPATHDSHTNDSSKPLADADPSPVIEKVTAPSTDAADPNQRALDRVTYLGGLLLPTSLVASILSMNADFEPGQPLFWVLWAAAAPLTILTVVVIYADKLRRAEVWVEEGGVEEEERVHDSGGGGKYEGGGGGGGGGGTEGDDDYNKPPSLCLPGQETMTYAGVEDVVVDLSGAVDERVSVPVATLRARPPRSRIYADLQQHQHANNDEQRPTAAAAARAWRKKELGWGGAALCILRMRKPLRVEDGMPSVARASGGG